MATPNAPHAHHFPDAHTQYKAAKLGMWLFLATELLLFGVILAAFGVYHHRYPELFHEASLHLDRVLGTVNTVVLITSSLTVALAVNAAKAGRVDRVRLLLLVTIALAAVFGINKYFEYSAKFHHGIYPSTNLFFGFYFILTGLHMLHVIVGMAILGWVWWVAGKGRVSPEYYTPVEIGGLYWHLVDLIWIYLFPLLYLIG